MASAESDEANVKFKPIPTDTFSNNYPIVPRGFFESSVDAFKSDFSWLPSLYGKGAEVTGKVATGLSFAFDSDKLRKFGAKIDSYAQNVNEWNVKNQTYQHYMDISSNSLAGRFAGHTAGVVASIFPALVSGGFTAEAETGAAIAGEAASETGEAITNASNAINAADFQAKKSMLSNGFVQRMGKFNIYSMPYIVGASVQYDKNANAHVSMGEFAKNALIVNTLPLAIEAMPYGRMLLTKLGEKRLEYSAESAEKIEVPPTEELKPSEKPKQEPIPEISEKEKEFLDSQAKSGDAIKDEDSIIQRQIGVLPENLEDYYEIIKNPHHNAVLDTMARRAVLSKGLLFDGEKIAIDDLTYHLPIKKIVKDFSEFDKQKGLRQLYLNKKVQEKLPNSKNKAQLNEIDKQLFDAMPYRSTGAIKASSTFLKSEETGIRTFNHPEWFRYAKPEMDHEAFNKLTSLAKEGDEAAQYMRSLYNQSLLSKESRATKALLDHIKDALENPMTQEDASNTLKAYFDGEKDYFGEQLQANIDSAREEIENMDLEKYTDEMSPHYIKLIKNMNTDKLTTYITCMLG